MNSKLLSVRPANVEDIELLTEVGRRAFDEAFSPFNTPENMASYLADSFYPEKQAAEFEQAGSLFLIAEVDGIPAGYARLQAGSGEETCITGRKPVELVRIYLLSEWTGHGYGDILMEACLEAARSLSYDTMWLGVWEKNARALRFYEKWGFTRVGSHTFLLGSDLQEDIILEKIL